MTEEVDDRERPELDDYMSSLRGKAAETKRTYNSILRNFFLYVGYKEVGKFTLRSINEFLDHLEAEGRSTGTLASYTIVLRSYLEFHGRDDLSSKIKTPGVERRKRTSVRWVDWEDMFEVAGYDSRNGDRNQAILAVLLGTGMRVGEAVCIRGKQIDWQNERILVPHAKGKKSEVFYHMVLLDDLNEYLKPWAGRKTESYVFPGHKMNTHMSVRNVRAIIKKIAIASNIQGAERISPHSMRHSLAHYLLYEKKWDALIVKQILNHVRLDTTMIYVEDSSEARVDLANFIKEHR